MFNFIEIFIPVKGRATAESVVRREGESHIRTDVIFVEKKPDDEKKHVAATQNISKTK